MTKILIIVSAYISIIFSQNNEKIVLKSEIQEYLFSTQRILHDFIKLEDEVFNQKRNSKTSKALEMNAKMLLKNKNDFHRSKNRKYNIKEKKLIAQIDNYTTELKNAITHLKLLSIKKNGSTSQLVFEQSDDKEKFINLKKSFENEGQRLNALLNEFILTNIPVMAH